MKRRLPLLALNGHGAMSDLRPLCTQKRTYVQRGSPELIQRETPRRRAEQQRALKPRRF